MNKETANKEEQEILKEFDDKFCHATEMSGLTAIKDTFTGGEFKAFLLTQLRKKDAKVLAALNNSEFVNAREHLIKYFNK